MFLIRIHSFILSLLQSEQVKKDGVAETLRAHGAVQMYVILGRKHEGTYRHKEEPIVTHLSNWGAKTASTISPGRPDF
jgi:hypothetical protein